MAQQIFVGGKARVPSRLVAGSSNATIGKKIKPDCKGYFLTAPNHRVKESIDPKKPLLIYDGGCGFCSRWIRRWQAVTGDRVRYEPSESAAPRFPEIPASEFARAVQWVGADGRRAAGAEAVFLALATATFYGRFALWLYVRISVFARTSEALYRWVAAHRK